MANPLDTDAGSELFGSYEAELKLVQADLNQKLDHVPELSGEPRKSAIRQAERVLDEANELVGCPPSAVMTGRLCTSKATVVLLTLMHPSLTKCASRNKTSLPQRAAKQTNASATTSPTSTPASVN